MKSKIISLLHEHKNKYVSGEQISEELGITRSAVWKVINAVKDEGGIIDAAAGKGYKLIKLPDLLKPEYLSAFLNDPPEIRWFKEIDSTNNYLKDLSRNNSVKEAIASSELQTGGKGRLGRVWSSPEGESIQMSFLIKPDAPPSAANEYNIAGTLGVCKAIKKVCGIDVQIKWPNDIVYSGKKVCGILTEMSTDMNRIEFIVFGAGINVNQKKFEGELRDKAISLRMIKGKKIDRLALCAAEINCVFDYFKMVDLGETEKLMREYEKKSAVLGKSITLISLNNKVSGICEGFGPGGELLLNIDGKIKPYHAGEVSLRGEHGYV